MTLMSQPRGHRRMFLMLCAQAADSPLTAQEKQAGLDRLNGDKDWVPTPQDTPVPFGKVEAWHAKTVAGRRVRHG